MAGQWFVCLVMMTVCASSSRVLANRVRLEETKNDESADPGCAEAVPGSKVRKCWNRGWLFNTCGKKICKCPIYAEVKGDNAVCEPFYVDGDDRRKFDPTKLKGKGCACVTPVWVPTARKVITDRCPVESYFGNKRTDLPDFAATTLDWCNSQQVPAHKRVPEALRGLYWMRGGNPADVAFCTTRAEWDPVKRTAVISPWTDFVWRKKDGEGTPHNITQNIMTAKYFEPYLTMTFNEDLTYAAITAEVGILNWLLDAPLEEIDKTPEGAVDAWSGKVMESIVSTKKGDIFARPTSVAFKGQIGMYYAVRIVDDAGVVNQDWYKLMEEAEHAEGLRYAEGKGTSFVRYEQDC